jgi:hypothetical protein
MGVVGVVGGEKVKQASEGAEGDDGHVLSTHICQTYTNTHDIGPGDRISPIRQLAHYTRIFLLFYIEPVR